MSTEPCGIAENKCKCKISPRTTTPLMCNEVFKNDNLKRAHKYDGGVDIRSVEDKVIMPKSYETIATGLKTAIPAGYVGMIRGRSGLAFKYGITTFNGTIDASYRNFINCILFNMSNEPYKVNKGDRIAQMLTVKVMLENYVEVDELPEADDGRGENGFGSTGV